MRARRRCLELEQKGTPQPYEEVLRDVEERDYQDAHRAVAPMKPAPDAVLLDTSGMDLDESVQALLGIIREKVGA